jgi:hypothetical protein
MEYDRGTCVTGGPKKCSYGLELLSKLVAPIRFS